MFIETCETEVNFSRNERVCKRIKKLLTLAKKYIYIGRFGHYCCLLQQR